MSFEKHEAIVNLLFSELQREPLEGFRRPTMGQLAAADREIHVKLSEKTRSGLPMGPQGELPLDQYVQQVLEMPAVMWLLMPKPKAAAAEKPSNAAAKPAPKKPAALDDALATRCDSVLVSTCARIERRLSLRVYAVLPCVPRFLLVLTFIPRFPGRFFEWF
jgi:hypothetical protein